MKQPILYFAFGSNLDRTQMRRRCPQSALVGPASLPKHRLVFGGFSRHWKGAVATVVRDAEADVPGLLYALSASDLTSLDRAEGHPRIYERVVRYVVDAKGRRHRACTYRLPPAKVVTCFPGFRYFHIIRRGYERHGFDVRGLLDAAFWEIA